MDHETPLADRLRDRILNALHLGLLHPGDRLPSIRALWREMGVDHRVVAAAYRELEEEGLVEVRGRSGVYVARQDQMGGEVLAETARWIAGVCVEGWKRRIPVAEVPDLLRRCTAQRALRCACVESSVDQMRACCAEVEEQFGMTPVPVYVSPVPLPRPDRSVEYYGVMDRLKGVDLAVTTSHHSRMVRHAGDVIGCPVVTLTLNAGVVETVQQHLRYAPLTLVAVDSVFGERFRSLFAPGEEDAPRIRVVLADGPDSLAGLDPAEPIVLTRAARERTGELPNPLLFPHAPTFSPETARELMETMIRLNLRGETPREEPRAMASAVA